MNTSSLPSHATPQRILIADDCSTSRMMEQLVLRRGGYDILLASDGEEAVKMARERSPDLILLDMQMPGLDGLAALRSLKRSAATRDIPVIVVTVSGDPAVRRDAVESGCVAFLTKPVETAELASTVAQTLAAGRSRASRASAYAPVGADL